MAYGDNDNMAAMVGALHNDLLKPSVAGRMANEIIDPSLIWEKFLTTRFPVSGDDIVREIRAKNSSGQYTTPGRNEFKKKLQRHADGTLYPRVRFGDYKVTHEGIAEWGFAYDITESVMRPSPMNVKKLRDAYRYISRNIQEWVNWEILDGALNSLTYSSGGELSGYLQNEDGTGMGYDSTYGFICGKLAAGSYWNGGDPDFVTDISNLKTMFNSQTTSAPLSKILMHETVLEKIKLWFYENDRSYEQSPIDAGMLGGRSAIRLDGIDLIGLTQVDGLDYGGTDNRDKIILLTDQKAATTYTKIDPPRGFIKGAPTDYVMTRRITLDDETNTDSMLFRVNIRTVLEPTYTQQIGILEVY